jgi:phosphate-selective porin OprO/OprP
VGRLTWLPMYLDDGERLLHLGFSVRQASAFNGTFRVRTRSAIRSGLSAVWPLPADTGTFVADDGEQLNGEFAAVCGPVTLQADYLVNFVNRAQRSDGVDVGTVFFHGGYVQALYYLTGEHDRYNRKSAAFDRVIPLRDASRSGAACPLFCGGAWQLGVRYNHLDLNSDGIQGSVLNDVTAGVNWFLNPNMKLQWNYSATHRESGSGIGDGWIHGFGMRLAHDF